MNQTLQEVNLTNKTVVLNKSTYYNNKETINSVSLTEVSSEVNQFLSFIKLIPSNLLERFDTEEKKINFLRKLYLDSYANLIQKFIKSQNNSIFLKTKQDLNADFDGVTILENLNFFEILDVQQIKDEILNSLNKNSCLVMNTETPTSVSPLQKEIIKSNLQLACRTHIVDFKLRKVNLTSVFDNTEFYKFDNTLPNYLFDIFVERIKNLSISYYQSLIEILSEEIEILSENGEELIDPINKQKVIFELPITNANKEQNFINYLKNIFDKEFISISENFNSFFKVKLSKGDKKITLSNLITTKQFFIDSLPVISRFELNQIDKSNLMFYVDIKNEELTSTVTIKLAIKAGLTSYDPEAITLINSNPFTINNPTATILDVSQEQILLAKEQIQNNNKFETLINFIFPLQKILNFSAITTILMCSNYYENSNSSFDPSIKTIANIHSAAADGTQQNLCDELDNPNSSFGFDLEIAKIIAQTPIEIIKSIEETYDPNIVIANKLKKAAELVGSPDLSIIPYSALLMVPPPFGPAIPIVPPLGFVYWGISAAETLINTAKGNNSYGFDFDRTESGPQKKNPFNSSC
jgi:hypothetical protein